MTASSAKLLGRARVRRRIAEAAAHPVAVVLAPAGCGKSIALQQYLDSLDTPYLRYDVRAEHATLLGFVRGLAEVVAEVAPGARGTVVDAVRAALDSPNPGAALAAWMLEHLPAYAGTIAVDDFHAAEADPNSAAFLAALIEATGATTKWIVATRSTMHLPLSSWIVYGRCGIPVGEADLNFTPQEAREAARAICAGDADADDLLAKTGGWATAFALALRLWGKVDPADGAAAASRLLSYQYLAEQVFYSLSDDERTMLVFGALLPEFDSDVFERAGFPRARARLKELQRKVTFLSVVPADSHGASPRRYRCHDLFRDFLDHMLAMRSEAEVRALELRAAGALRACGNIAAALDLYAQARASEEMLPLLELHGFDLMRQAQGDAVVRAIEALPETLQADPVALGVRGLQAHEAGEFDRARAAFERAIESCGEPAFKARLIALWSYSMLNARERPVPYLDETARDERLPLDLRCELLALLALSRARFGPHEGIDGLWDEVEKLAGGVDSETARATIFHLLGVSARLHGDHARAQRLLTRGVERAVANGMFSLATKSYAALAASADITGDRERALAWLERSSDAALKSGSPRSGIHALGGQLSIALRRGGAEDLERLLAAYDALAGPEQPNLAATARSARAMLAALRGRFAEAYRFESEAIEGQAYRHGFEEARMMAMARCAFYLCAAGRDEDAARAIERTLREIESAPLRNRPQAGLYCDMASALCALAAAQLGRFAAARRILQKKPRTADPAARALREAVAKTVRAAMHVAAADLAKERAELEERWYGNYARLLELALRKAGAGRSSGVAPTPTELAVIRAIAEGSTPKQIAAASGCSVNTVRGHVRSLIGKFGCSGRDQAIRIARARGLF
jgi:LuxR family transcriptional regulator, maltose regulon positive regulatory protein